MSVSPHHFFLQNIINESPHLILFLMLEDGLQESSALVAGGLLVKHAGLDDLLVHVEFVFGSGQDLLLHAVHSTETQHTHLVLLPDTMGSILSLQILRDNIDKLHSRNNTRTSDQTMTQRGSVRAKTGTDLMRVPVTVKDDDSVGRLQVQTQTSGSGTQQKDEVLKGWIIKVLQQRATIFSFSGSYRHKTWEMRTTPDLKANQSVNPAKKVVSPSKRRYLKLRKAK